MTLLEHCSWHECNNRSVPVLHTHLWYRKNPTAILVFALLILIIVSLNNGRHRFLLIQFEYQSILRLWEGWVRNSVNHTGCVAVVTPTDRHRSVHNRCVIELFCGVVWVVDLRFWHFCWCRGFCHRTESDLFLFVFALHVLEFVEWGCHTFRSVLSLLLLEGIVDETKL